MTADEAEDAAALQKQVAPAGEPFWTPRWRVACSPHAVSRLARIPNRSATSLLDTPATKLASTMCAFDVRCIDRASPAASSPPLHPLRLDLLSRLSAVTARIQPLFHGWNLRKPHLCLATGLRSFASQLVAVSRKYFRPP